MLTRRILLVDDDSADAELTALALARAGIEHKFVHASDAETALAILHREPPHAEEPAPALMLLDLNLPPRGGLSLLSEVKRDDRIRRVPVVVFSSSARPDDIRSAYDLGANAYVEKPRDLKGFVEVLREVAHHWLSVVKPYPGL